MELAAALLVGAALGFRAGVSLNDDGQHAQEAEVQAEASPSEISEDDAAAAAAAAAATEDKAKDVAAGAADNAEEEAEDVAEPPWKKAREAEPPAQKWAWNNIDRKWEKVNPSSSSNQAPEQKEEQWKPPDELDLRWCDCCESYGYLRKRACVNFKCVAQLQSNELK
jgi:hypothetical protein